MKSNKKSSNKEKLFSLASVFNKTVAEEREKARTQIHSAKNLTEPVLKTPVSVAPQISVALDTEPVETTPMDLVVEKVEYPRINTKPVGTSRKNIQIEESVKQEGRGPATSVTSHLLPVEMEKLKALRRYLVERGVDAGITNGQLIRLAVREIELSSNLSERYHQIHSEDGRKHRFKFN